MKTELSMPSTVTTIVLAVLTFVVLASQAIAQDLKAGEKSFRKCQACHIVQAPNGEILAGKNGRTGPNLFNLIGRRAGSLQGFRYQKALVELGESGFLWSSETIAEYLLDPKQFLRAQLNDSGARTAMTFRITKESEAKNIAAFLRQYSPDP